MALLLTCELLRAYEQRLRDAGLVIVEILRPGLSEAEIDAHTADLGLRLPHEAKVWFGWHNGYEPTGFQELIGAGIEMLSLRAAIDWYTTLQPQISDVWRPEWFPIASGLVTVLCDCSVVGVQPTPVRVLDLPENVEPATPVLPSMGALIELWIEAWDRGWWYAAAPNNPAVTRAPLGLADRRRSVLGY